MRTMVRNLDFGTNPLGNNPLCSSGGKSHQLQASRCLTNASTIPLASLDDPHPTQLIPAAEMCVPSAV